MVTTGQSLKPKNIRMAMSVRRAFGAQRSGWRVYAKIGGDLTSQKKRGARYWARWGKVSETRRAKGRGKLFCGDEAGP